MTSPQAQPTLYFKDLPTGEVLQDSLLTFRVSPIAPGAPMPDDCALWRSPAAAGNQLAGHAARVDAASLPADSAGKVFSVRPSDSGSAGPKLPLGFHYLVAACGDGNTVTPEVPLLVVTRRAASISAPKALETSPSPDISWSAVPGVPAYHLLLSDQALEIDTEKGTVGGASIIWQAITTKTSIPYGVPDPSGNFAKVPAPPLSPGVTYNLVVLNNYDGRSALASSAKAQALKLFALQAPAAPLSKPGNLDPAPGRILTVSSDSAITFRWTSSRSQAGPANTYKLVLYGLEEEDGSEILVPIFSGDGTDTSLRVDAKRTLLSKRYTWKVFAQGSDGFSVVGDTTSFTYRNDVQTLILDVTGPGPSGGAVPLKDVRIEVVPLDGGANAIPIFTPSGGHVEKVLSVGGYTLEFSKDGHVTQERTVTLAAGDPLEVEVLLPAAASRITGRAMDAGGLSLDNVEVTAATADRTLSARTDAQGYFLLGVPAGSHAVSFRKPDYQGPADTVVTVKAAEAVDLGKVTLTRPQGSLSGTVRNDKGQPLANCQVLIRTPAGNVVRSLVTDDKGGFAAFVTPGGYVVSASRTGFTTEERSLQLADAATLSLQLMPGASLIKGRVDLKAWKTAAAPSAAPLPGAQLELRHAFTGALQKTTADLRGEWAFSADTGAWLLKALFPGKARPESALVRIDRVRSTVIRDLELRGFASVQGTIAMLPAAPADPSLISLGLLRLPGLEQAASATAGGSPEAPVFSLENVPDGSYRLTCGAPGYGLDGEPTVIVKDGVWITGLPLTLLQASKSVTLLLRHAGRTVPGSVRLSAPRQAELRAGTRFGPAAPGTWILGAVPDSAALIPASRAAFALPASGAADTTFTVNLPFAHHPPANPLVFRNRTVELVLETQTRIDSAWIVHGYGAPADTFRIPADQLGGFVDEPKAIRFDPGPQGGLLTYFFIVRAGALAYVNDAPDRRFRARVEPSGELSFLRVSAGDSLSLPARSRMSLAVHAYDAAGRRIDTAVDRRGKVTWDADGVASARPAAREGRALSLSTGAAPAPLGKGTREGSRAAEWDSLKVTVELDGLSRTLAVPARVVAGRINKLELSSSLGETPAIPSPAPFGLFVTGWDTTASPPLELVPSPAFALDPPEAGEVAEREVRLDPRFIGPLRIKAVHEGADGSRAEAELGEARDSTLRGINVGQTLPPADTGRLFFHGREFEMRVPDSAHLSEGRAVLRLYRRKVAKSFAGSAEEAVAGPLWEVSNPSGAAFGKPLRLNLGIPDPFQGRGARAHALKRFETARLGWMPLADTAVADTTLFGDPSLAAATGLLDGHWYGLLARSRPLSAGAVEILPNPFSPLVTAARDGNTRAGTRIRFSPESDRSAEVTVSIRIYNLDNELVRTLVDHKTVPKAPADFYWDGKADGGRWVRNGRYLVKISLNATGTRQTRHLVKPVVVFR